MKIRLPNPWPTAIIVACIIETGRNALVYATNNETLLNPNQRDVKQLIESSSIPRKVVYNSWCKIQERAGCYLVCLESTPRFLVLLSSLFGSRLGCSLLDLRFRSRLGSPIVVVSVARSVRGF